VRSQKLTYSRIRAEYGLSAQIAIHCLAKVADSYKLDRKVMRTYRPYGSIAYDDRILSFKLERQVVSIWTMRGRETVPFTCGERQKLLLQSRQGESDLVYRKGTFYLLVTCNVDEPETDDRDKSLGVDLGIVAIATDSDGETYSGEAVERSRKWFARRRAALQSVGTKSAKRRLKRLSGQQHRFQADVNHIISKKLDAKAKGTARGIALEDLTHLRKRTTVQRSQRARHSNWAFRQLRGFIQYKAALAGVQVFLLAPAYTSRTCSVCGCCDKRNRPTQATFRCVSCGHSAPADVNADGTFAIGPKSCGLWSRTLGFRDKPPCCSWRSMTASRSRLHVGSVVVPSPSLVYAAWHLQKGVTSMPQPSAEHRLATLGIVLPEASEPAAMYANFVHVNGLLFVSGKGPAGRGESAPRGRLGAEFTTEQGYQFARETGIEILAVLRSALGSLGRITQVVKVQGFVNATPEFDEHHKVLNGCSDLFIEVFGDIGVHARSVLGATSLRNNLPIVIDSIFAVEM
jgi:putative transposase